MGIKLDEVIYLLSSDKKIYQKRTWDTAHTGVAYADSMGLKYNIIDFDKKFNGVYLLDTMIHESECLRIIEILNKFKDSIFLFKIIDPYFEYERGKHFFKLLFKIAHFRNVFFVTNLYPKELTQELNAYTNERKMLFLPYPYQEQKEIKCIEYDFLGRKNKICFSGAVNDLIYPNRSLFIKKWKYNPLLWNKIEKIKHPGYVDSNDKQLHNVVGDFYVEYLSNYRIMYLDASRSYLEFVKFSECAYAHCFPIGESPASFDSSFKQYFKEINYSKLSSSIKYVLSINQKEQFNIAQGYRNIFKKERNKILLQHKLLDFLNNINL
jgi:hypothetical protein